MRGVANAGTGSYQVVAVNRHDRVAAVGDGIGMRGRARRAQKAVAARA
jgi:hypothetical protein